VSAVLAPPAALLEFVVERVNVGVLAVDRAMNVRLWNRFMADHSGLSSAEVIGRKLFDACPDLPATWLKKKVDSVFLLKGFSFTSWEQRPYLFRFHHDRPVTGGIDWMQQNCTFLPMRDAGGEVEAVCITVTDATDAALAQRALERSMEKLRVQARIDGLTGIANRRHLEKRLSEEFGRHRRYGTPLALVMFDIDHFKRVNDVHGHPAGDEVIRAVAARASGQVRTCDVLGRYGGEEFAVLLPETDLAGARVAGEKMRALVAAAPIPYKDVRLDVTVSVGVAQVNAGCLSHEDLIRAADAALYRAKNSGRNRTSD